MIPVEPSVLVAEASWYEVVGGVGAGIGGIGAAAGALFAWRAAGSSRDASRDARDALAFAMVPSISLDFYVEPKDDSDLPGRWTARIINLSSQFAACDVALEVSFHDGYRFAQSIERLAPGEWDALVMREIRLPPGGPTAEEAGETATLRYSDERRIARYEQRYGFLSRKASDGSLLAQPTAVATEEPRQISP